MTERVFATPHLNKINAALVNLKAVADLELLHEAREAYRAWIAEMDRLTSTGRERVNEMVRLLNDYKDALEVELIMRRGSAFLKGGRRAVRSSTIPVLEEFLIRLVDSAILPGIEGLSFVTGPQNAFMSLSLLPTTFESLAHRPAVVFKSRIKTSYLERESTTTSHQASSLSRRTRRLVILCSRSLLPNAK